MNNSHSREPRHGHLKLAALVLPAMLMVACESGVSGHAPGLAGVQTQDPGTLNFPLAYVKRPPPPRPPTQTADIDVRDLIPFPPRRGSFQPQAGERRLPEINITSTITKGMGDVRDLDVSPDGKKL